MSFKLKFFIVSAVTILLAVGVFVWIVILDKGALVVTSEAPYEIKVEGARLKTPEYATCTTSRCVVPLPSGRYTAVFTKGGHYDTSIEFEIARGEETPLEIDFEFIPDVEEVSSFEEFELEFDLDSPYEDLSEHFSFGIDSTYQKQYLSYTDPDTSESTVWSYFDRTLEDPVVFAHPTGASALVFDRAQADSSLYLIDGVNFKRSSIGSVAGVETVEWNVTSNDVLVEAALNGDDTYALWVYDSTGEAFYRWPFGFDLSKVTWDGEGRLVFATTQELEALEGSQIDSTYEALTALLNGEAKPEAIAFFIGQYDVRTRTYETLYEVPGSLGVTYQDVILFYDNESDRVYFTDETVVYEVVRD